MLIHRLHKNRANGLLEVKNIPAKKFRVELQLFERILNGGFVNSFHKFLQKPTFEVVLKQKVLLPRQLPASKSNQQSTSEVLFVGNNLLAKGIPGFICC